ncbi:methylmalonyl-CoA mutase family protein [Pseudovibrio sp. WM33]|uniref:methylmalonyl-CoA mutase family protein n=1 Tax=Pseudovibrio sp. WM33 TaxID=1735585 RepID=UPI0007AE4F14|nr:methylmalonyl-CoA mutase family protein [Pseudovibrio sp. WM33]KZL20293.1 Methylmalonyl-CoA mutase [Pseudovibrio sp. WM33]
MSTGSPKGATKDRPWMFRTYAGHSNAADSNRLYRTNLAKGQTGLSVAFDLPTQTGYDPDHPLSRGEVGKVGVPISHLGDMHTLFNEIPLERMNTSMTINATAPWLLALYAAAADEQGADRSLLAGTTQNDLIKEYLSRGTYVFPPTPSMRLTTDVISWTYTNMPKWNPMNVCSYHLQEAGATPVQELSFALATAIAILDNVRASGVISESDFPKLVGRISFFVNAGMRFITEMCKMRAFTELWDEICRDRYGVEEERYRRFRYGVQVNSLGLTEPQPENNVYRILVEMLAVVLSKNARARAVQLPAWNEALGLPRPFDQQWSLRMQQIMAYETDLLEYADIFDGSKEIETKVEALKEQAREELARIAEMGGAVAAVESSYMKQKLVESNSKRLAGIESGDQIVVGVNKWTETEPSPLASDEDGGILTVPEHVEEEAIQRIQTWRAERDENAVKSALLELRAAASSDNNIMEASIKAAQAGATTGEWGATLREVFGEYRAPTGVGKAAPDDNKSLAEVQKKVSELSEKLGRRLKFLVGKPGLDGHSNGAEQIAVRARDCGMEVVYEGIRLTPAQIVNAALEEGVHVVGLSILSGSHLALVHDVLDKMKENSLEDIPIIIGGIIPSEDAEELKNAGVAAVYTPKDFHLTEIMSDIVRIVDEQVNETV